MYRARASLSIALAPSQASLLIAIGHLYFNSALVIFINRAPSQASLLIALGLFY
jgi:hypothetical protein